MKTTLTLHNRTSAIPFSEYLVFNSDCVNNVVIYYMTCRNKGIANEEAYSIR